MSLLLLFKDITAPISVFISQTATKVSRVTGKNSISITFQGNEGWSAWQVRLVSSPSDPIDAGNLVTSGTTTGLANTDFTTAVTDAQIEDATGVEGNNILKVFIQDLSNLWST